MTCTHLHIPTVPCMSLHIWLGLCSEWMPVRLATRPKLRENAGVRLGRILAASKPIWWVYALSGPDRVPVYVGMSKRPESRSRWHRGVKAHHNQPLAAWVKGRTRDTFELLDSFPTKRMAMDAELEYIRYLQPRFNTIGK